MTWKQISSIGGVEYFADRVIRLLEVVGDYGWTCDHDFLAKKFEVVFDSGSEDFYGEYVPEPLLCRMLAR